MEKALIDTDIWLDIMKGVHPRVREHAEVYWNTFGQFTLSVITVAEVVRGLVKRQRVEALARWRAEMEALEILPIDRAVGDLAGELYARLEQAGTPIGRWDPLIAATALHHRLVLVSANVRHYARVVEVGYPLRVENWRENQPLTQAHVEHVARRYRIDYWVLPEHKRTTFPVVYRTDGWKVVRVIPKGGIATERPTATPP
jgi:tRNA(fMet)-specific endonuclease VapC